MHVCSGGAVLWSTLALGCVMDVFDSGDLALAPVWMLIEKCVACELDTRSRGCDATKGWLFFLRIYFITNAGDSQTFYSSNSQGNSLLPLSDSV